MSVFRHIVVVGVSGAITLGNMGQGSSTPLPMKPQSSTPSTNLETNKEVPTNGPEAEVVESGVISHSHRSEAVSQRKNQDSLLEKLPSKSTPQGVKFAPISSVQIDRIFKNLPNTLYLYQNQEFKAEILKSKKLANLTLPTGSLLENLTSKTLSTSNNALQSQPILNKQLLQIKPSQDITSQAKYWSNTTKSHSSLQNSLQSSNQSETTDLALENHSKPELNLPNKFPQIPANKDINSTAKSWSNTTKSHSSLLNSLQSSNQSEISETADLGLENQSKTQLNLPQKSQQIPENKDVKLTAKSSSNTTKSHSSLLNSLQSSNQSEISETADLGLENQSKTQLNLPQKFPQIPGNKDVNSTAKSSSNTTKQSSNQSEISETADLGLENPSKTELNLPQKSQQIPENKDVKLTAKSWSNTTKSQSSLQNFLESNQSEISETTADLGLENPSKTQLNLPQKSQQIPGNKDVNLTAKSWSNTTKSHRSLLNSIQPSNQSEISETTADLGLENHSKTQLNLPQKSQEIPGNKDVNLTAKSWSNTTQSHSNLQNFLESNQSEKTADLTLGNSSSKIEINLNKKSPQIKTSQDLYSLKQWDNLSPSNSSVLELSKSNTAKQQTQAEITTFKKSITQNPEKVNQNVTSEAKNLANLTINSGYVLGSNESKSESEITANPTNQEPESKINTRQSSDSKPNTSRTTNAAQITTSINYAPTMATVNDLARVETKASALMNSNSHSYIHSKSTIPQQITLPGRTRQNTTESIQFPSTLSNNSTVGNAAQIMTSTSSTTTTTTVPNLARVENQTFSPITSSLTVAQQTTPSQTPIESFPPPVPNGTLQTNPPAKMAPNPNPLHLPITPDEVQIKETIPISLEEAIDLARRNNPGIQITQLELERSRAVMREAQATLWPRLTFQSTLQRTESASGDLQAQAQRRIAEVTNRPEFQDTDIQNFPTTTFTNDFEFDYDTGLGGTRAARIGVAREQIRLRELELERIAEELRLNVSNDYYDLQESDGRVRIGEAAVKNARKSLEDAEALERAGVGTRFDVLQSQVTLANEQQNLTNALRDQRAARRRLAERLSISESLDLTAADPIEPAGSWPLSLDETIVQAFEKRAELEQQLVQRDLSEEQRKLALSAVRPSLNFFATYSVLGLTTDNTSWRAARGWADGTTVGARFRWNFFDGGAARAAAEQSRIDQDIAVTRFEQVQNQVRREVEEAFFSLEASFENIATAELGVEQAKEALRLARLRFQAGVGTQLEVIQQETDLTRAENNLLTAIIDYNRALSELQRAVSNLPGGDLSDVP